MALSSCAPGDATAGRGGREIALFAVAAVALACSAWAFVGAGSEAILWALPFAALGVPARAWNRRRRACARRISGGVR